MMSISLGDVLHLIGQGLKLPCLTVLLVLLAVTLWQVGDLLVEKLKERRGGNVNVPELLQKIHANRQNLPDLIEHSGLTKRQRQAINTLLAAGAIPLASQTALAQQLLADEEKYFDRITGVTDMVAKLGPMFGLMGTLIPLGPGITALSQGDTATLAESLGIAFDTTIAGLIAAAVCLLISNIRQRWYESDLTALETIMDCILEEARQNAA